MKMTECERCKRIRQCKGKGLCESCYGILYQRAHPEWWKPLHLKHALAYQKRNLENGKCAKCANPRVPKSKVSCEKHLLYSRAYGRIHTGYKGGVTKPLLC